MPGSASGSAAPDSIRSDLQAFAAWAHALASLSDGADLSRALPLLERARAWFTATRRDALADTVEQARGRAIAALTRHQATALADLRVEHAEVLVLYARALARQGRDDQARLALRGAQWLLSSAGLKTAAARVQLLEAERAWVAGDAAAAAEAALSALPVLHRAADAELALHARWLLGDVLRACGPPVDALDVLESLLAEAEVANFPRVVQRCRVSLGVLATQMGDRAGARRAVAAAINGRPDSTLDKVSTPTLLRILLRLEESLEPAPFAADTAFVEYFSLDGALLALVLTDGGPRLVVPLCSEYTAGLAARALRFQVGSMACGSAALRRHTFDLTRRTRHHLARLYDLLLRPLEDAIGQRHLVIAPHAALHGVPFPALFDGTNYLIEVREVVLAPGTGGPRALADTDMRPLAPRRAVLVAPAAASQMHFVNEVRALEPLFDDAVTLLGRRATLPDLRPLARGADVVHLAHADWLTPHAAARLDLKGALVTLSSRRDDASPSEMAGLTRALLLAGARNVLTSLWNMDDDANLEVMSDFYLRMRAGDRPSAALRHAQRRVLQTYPHPFFWASMALAARR